MVTYNPARPYLVFIRLNDASKLHLTTPKGGRVTCPCFGSNLCKGPCDRLKNVIRPSSLANCYNFDTYNRSKCYDLLRTITWQVATFFDTRILLMTVATPLALGKVFDGQPPSPNSSCAASQPSKHSSIG